MDICFSNDTAPSFQNKYSITMQYVFLIPVAGVETKLILPRDRGSYGLPDILTFMFRHISDWLLQSSTFYNYDLETSLFAHFHKCPSTFPQIRITPGNTN